MALIHTDISKATLLKIENNTDLLETYCELKNQVTNLMKNCRIGYLKRSLQRQCI